MNAAPVRTDTPVEVKLADAVDPTSSWSTSAAITVSGTSGNGLKSLASTSTVAESLRFRYTGPSSTACAFARVDETTLTST